MKDPRLRFMEKVMSLPFSSCWLWCATKASGRSGKRKRLKLPYGKFCLNNKTIPAHRASWMLFKGDIGPGLFVLHKCDNPSCVNPDHLFLGNNTDNVKDMLSKGRSLSGEKNKAAVLKEDDVLEILRLRFDGRKTLKHIAEKYGIGITQVHRIVGGQSWTRTASKHLYQQMQKAAKMNSSEE